MEPGVLFGLGSAVSFGAGDFTGGLASRRAPALLVAGGAQVIGLVLLLAILAVVRPAAPDAAAVVFGGVAGLFGGAGLVALYQGLSLGSMGLVTALSGVGSVAIPFAVGVTLLGNPLGPLQVVGVVAAVAAGATASGATLAGVRRDAVLLALVAAIGFGLWFTFLDIAADQHELWALVASRGSASILVGGLALALTRGRGGRRVWPLVLVAGAMDVAGNGAFVLSTGTIPVGIAAALSGLYPLVTMLLAAAVLRERLPALGLVAVLLAVTGIVLISIG